MAFRNFRRFPRAARSSRYSSVVSAEIFSASPVAIIWLMEMLSRFANSLALLCEESGSVTQRSRSTVLTALSLSMGACRSDRHAPFCSLLTGHCQLTSAYFRPSTCFALATTLSTVKPQWGMTSR